MAVLDISKSNLDYFEIISNSLSVTRDQVSSSFELFKNGSTIPFIARYRKEKTGSLDEDKLRKIQEKLDYFQELEERKATALRRIEAQKKLTPELRKKIENAVEKVVIEDLYLPYKLKKKTRATAARDAGLEPLARIMEKLEKSENLETAAKPFVNPDKKIKTEKEAISGAFDILAEEVSENAEWKDYIRKREQDKAVLSSEVSKKHKDSRSKFETYYEFKEKVASLPSHRILALRRGEKEGVLKTTIAMDDAHNFQYLKEKAVQATSPIKEEMEAMAEDAYRRLIKPSIESEIRQTLKKKADLEAIEVFRKNLKDVLLAPPAAGKTILGVDPGFKSGTKLAIIDKTGKYLEQRTIYPLPPQKEEAASKTILLAMIENFDVEMVAIGNGTASREIDDFVSDAIGELEKKPIKLVVSEAGTSVYSASPVARQEFPDLDVTIRGAISIARRVQDPLAELVKIEPKSIGVGQYQYDVNQTELKKKLEQVVETCVNSVGVDVNTASEPLLNYVSGINKTLAKSIIKHRNARGPFKSRASMVKVPHFGPKAFEQAAGFMRVPHSENPLDTTAVHPESYEVVTQICEKQGLQLNDIIRNKEALEKVPLKEFATDEMGLPTLLDIKSELEKPGRDPRKKFAYANFNPKVKKISDLEEQAWVEGVVTNVTDFGVFVDVGVHQDGLVHISEISNRYVSDLSSYVSTGDVVKVRVLSADSEQKRISLSLKEKSQSGKPAKRSKGPKGPPRKKRKPATVEQLKNKYSTDSKKKQNTVKLKFSLKSIMKSGR